jgi:hypothetical protein
LNCRDSVNSTKRRKGKRHNGPPDSISKQQLRQTEKKNSRKRCETTNGAIFVHTGEGTSQDKEYEKILSQRRNKTQHTRKRSLPPKSLRGNQKNKKKGTMKTHTHTITHTAAHTWFFSLFSAAGNSSGT